MIASELMGRVRNYLYAGSTDQLNRLLEPCDGSSLVLEHPATGLHPGTTVSCGMSTLYVVAAPSPGMAAYRTMRIEGPEEVVPAGSLVRVSPRHSDYSVASALNDQIVSLSSPVVGMFSPLVLRLPVRHTTNVYSLPVQAEGYISIVSVMLHRSDRSVVQLNGWAPVGPQQIRVHEPVCDGSLEVVLRMPFKRFSWFLDDVEQVCGLGPSMLDVPVYGAAAALLGGDGGRRASPAQQADPRRATENPIDGVASMSKDLYRMRNIRAAEEAAALIANYPARMRGW
jgi:hypothetical protein